VTGRAEHSPQDYRALAELIAPGLRGVALAAHLKMEEADVLLRLHRRGELTADRMRKVRIGLEARALRVTGQHPSKA